MNVGILGYGIYVPRYRIKASEIASVWGKQAGEIERSFGISEKSVAGIDEDAVTIAYEAASNALESAEITPQDISSCFVGSESHPYAVNPTSTIVGEMLGIGPEYLAVDMEFACKAATAGLFATCGMIEGGIIPVGLVIGSDTAQSKPHDVLEYTAASAAAAYILSQEKKGCIATIKETVSYSSDTPDFWRRDGVRFPSHGGRFTGEPAYFTHVLGCARLLLEKAKLSASDFDYCVFHMPNGKFPKEAAKRLGFLEKQLAPSLIVHEIGNPYSASSLLGLAAVLDQSASGERIFMVSYGSGAGSDGFIIEVEEGIHKKRKQTDSFTNVIKDKKYISYVEYLKYGGKI